MNQAIKYTYTNTLKPVVPTKAGLYKFYDKNKKLLYVGHTNNLRRRVQSYRQKDDLDAHPTKAALRPRIHYYAYKAMPIQRARALEREIKKRAPHNHL